MARPETPSTSPATPIAGDAIRIERVLPGPRERVWRYLTDPALRRLWLADGPWSTTAGGGVELVFRNNGLTSGDAPPPAGMEALGEEARLAGTVLECTPPALLAFTWGTGPDASHVRFDLAEAGDKVRLTVTHSRVATRGTMTMVSAGWHAHLDLLADRLGERVPEGFWRSFTRLHPYYEKALPGG